MGTYSVRPVVKIIREENWWDARRLGRDPIFTLRLEAQGREWITDGKSIPYWIDHFQFLHDAPKISDHVLHGYLSTQSVAWREGRDIFALDQWYTNRILREAAEKVTHGVTDDMGRVYGYMDDWEQWLWYGFRPEEAREWAIDSTPHEAYLRRRSSRVSPTLQSVEK